MNVSFLLCKMGYINDIMRLLRKYLLTSFVEQYIADGNFVPKIIWKYLVGWI